MVTVNKQDVADAMHLSGTSELPDGHEADIDAAEVLVGEQVEPHAADGSTGMVNQCAVYVAAAFIAGTEGDHAVSELTRESATVRFDTDAASDEAVDFWNRAQAFDPTGRLGSNTGGSDALFEVF